jgi:hypothetical protein
VAGTFFSGVKLGLEKIEGLGFAKASPKLASGFVCIIKSVASNTVLGLHNINNNNSGLKRRLR